MPAPDRLRAALLGLLAAFLSISLSAVTLHANECGSEARLLDAVTDLFASASLGEDFNLDGAVSAADFVALAGLGAAEPCPLRAAWLRLEVANRTSQQQIDVVLRGRRLRCDCASDALATEFEARFTCIGGASLRCGEVAGLAPGEWLLEFAVEDPLLGQRQYRRAQLVADDATAYRSAWTAFASVVVVEDTAESGSGTLRDALERSRSMPQPLLIRFDDEAFPAGQETPILLETALPSLAADAVTIDGFDALGLRGNRIVDSGGLRFGALSITGARNHVVGLGLRNVGGSDRDIVRVFGPDADGNVLEALQIESAQGGDGISVDERAGKGFDTTVTVIRDCEIRGAGDKGIKVTTGAHALVQGSRIHSNSGGGVQATLGGNILALDNLVEDNGGLGAQNGFAVQGLDVDGGLATLALFGNVSRRNGANGLSVRGLASVFAGDNIFAGNGTSGLRVFNDIGPGAFALLEGSAVVCNAGDGVSVRDTSMADLGGGPWSSRGQNAFAYNDRNGVGVNLRSTVPSALSAQWSQWQSCGAGLSCDEARIASTDIRAPQAAVVIHPAEAPRGLAAPSVDRVEPRSGRAGDWIRVFGEGFDAIAAAAGACGDTTEPSGCGTEWGNCLRIGDTEVLIEAATPTMLLARLPFSCLEPLPLTVTVGRVQGTLASVPVEFCRND